MQHYSFTVQWSDADECYVARVPGFPGLGAHGDTPDEALREIQAALSLAIEAYQHEGWELPTPQAVAQA